MKRTFVLSALVGAVALAGATFVVPSAAVADRCRVLLAGCLNNGVAEKYCNKYYKTAKKTGIWGAYSDPRRGRVPAQDCTR